MDVMDVNVRVFVADLPSSHAGQPVCTDPIVVTLWTRLDTLISVYDTVLHRFSVVWTCILILLRMAENGYTLFYPRTQGSY